MSTILFSLFSPTKSVGLVVPPKGCKIDFDMCVYLEGKLLDYVDIFKYLGQDLLLLFIPCGLVG